MNALTPQAHEQAALWAAKIDGASLTGRDHQELAAWLAAAPGHRELLSRYCQLGTDLEETLPALVEAGLVARPEPTRRPARFRGWLGLAVAGVAAAIAVGWWLRPASPGATPVATAAAQRQAITLADGTRVELNARTSVLVEPAGEERRIRLSSGQAFLQVARDASHPFVVTTPAGTVRVTGTAFDVRCAAPDELVVTVTEGSVQVQAAAVPGAPVTLTRGHQLAAGGGSVLVRTLSPGALDDVLAWRDGQVVFADTRLDEALTRFAQHHGRTLRVLPAAASLTLGGRYRLDDLDGFLAALPAILPVAVSRAADGTVEVAPRLP